MRTPPASAIGILSVKTMVGLSNVLIYVMVGIVATLTIWYGRIHQAEAQRAFGPAATQPPEASISTD